MYIMLALFVFSFLSSDGVAGVGGGVEGDAARGGSEAEGAGAEGAADRRQQGAAPPQEDSKGL